MRWAVRIIAGTSRIAAGLTSALCILLIYAMLALLTTQVVMRYVFGAPPAWTEELAIMLFGWVVLLYASVGLREGSQVAIDMLPPHWRRLRWVSDRVVQLLVMGFGGLLLWSGWFYVLRTHGQRSAALQAPIEVLHLAAPVAGGLIALHALAMLVSPLKPAEASSGEVPLPAAGGNAGEAQPEAATMPGAADD